MSRLRIVFCGTPDSAVPSLTALAARRGDWEIVAVLSQPDRPAGRGRRPTASPVKQAALELGLDVHTPDRLKDARPTLEALRPDVIAVVAYGHIFRRWLLELPPLGCLNVHFSLLPRHRGVAPVAWAILEGDAETGVTTMVMDRGIDTGDVLREARTPVRPDDTIETLTRRLAQLGGPLLAETIAARAAGTLPGRPQPEEGATYARRLEKEDGRLDWSRPAVDLARHVRGLHPWPGAHTVFRGEGLKIHAAESEGGTLPPGELQVRDGVFVGTGSGRLRLVRVQRAGKAAADAEAWARGVRPEAGETLGGPA